MNSAQYFESGAWAAVVLFVGGGIIVSVLILLGNVWLAIASEPMIVPSVALLVVVCIIVVWILGVIVEHAGDVWARVEEWL